MKWWLITLTSFNERLKRINRRLGQLINKEERTVARQYALALTSVRKLLAEVYEKYEVDGKLTLDDMLKYNRLDKLIKEINFSLRHNYRDIYKTLLEALGNVYEDGYYLTAWAVESEVERDLRYSALKAGTIQASLINPIAGLTLNQRLEKQRTDIIYNIQQVVTAGLQNNATYATIAKELKKTFEDDAVKSMRVVRTEGHRVQELSKFQAVEHAKDNGVVMVKEWNTLEDSRVRNGKSNHRRLDGKVIPIEENFNDGLGKGKAPGQLGAAGSDINCRCFLTYRIVDIAKVKGKRVEAVAFEKWEKEHKIA